MTFPILLLPQRAGHLLYPGLEIRPVDDGSRGSSAHPPAISSELDYQNQGQSVLVVPNLRSTTVAFEPDGSGGVAPLVESQARRSEPSSTSG